MRTLRTDRERAAGIASATLTDGGATFLLAPDAFLTSADEPTFVVGRARGIRHSIVALVGFGADDVYGILQTARARGAGGVGTWQHEGRVYVDAVDVFSDLDAALAAARSRDQLAVWDAQNGAVIPVTAVPAA